MSTHPVIKALLDQLARNTSALERVQRERDFLEQSIRDARAFFETEAPETAPTPTPSPAPASPFAPKPGGPKDTLLGIIGRKPGISPADARRLARVNVVTESDNKARSVEEALRRMIADGVVETRDGGLHKIAGDK